MGWAFIVRTLIAKSLAEGERLAPNHSGRVGRHNLYGVLIAPTRMRDISMAPYTDRGQKTADSELEARNAAVCLVKDSGY
jgi:hypothetical protein